MKKFAFTLSEVLITLAIIGVVAALTIPNFIADYREKVTITQLSATYSLLDNAINLMIDDNGKITDYGTNNDERLHKVFELLPNYLQTIKSCEHAFSDKCIKSSYKMRVSDTGHSFIYYNPTFVLKNGALIAFYGGNGNCLQNKNLRYGWINSSTYATGCGQLWIDVNGGNSSPNVYDLDTFKFLIYSDGIVPAGRNEYDSSFPKNCLDDGNQSIRNGECTAWVLVNKNMDYLRCPEKLGWDKASSCKK